MDKYRHFWSSHWIELTVEDFFVDGNYMQFLDLIYYLFSVLIPRELCSPVVMEEMLVDLSHGHLQAGVVVGCLWPVKIYNILSNGGFD